MTDETRPVRMKTMAIESAVPITGAIPFSSDNSTIEKFLPVISLPEYEYHTNNVKTV